MADGMAEELGGSPLLPEEDGWPVGTSAPSSSAWFPGRFRWWRGCVRRRLAVPCHHGFHLLQAYAIKDLYLRCLHIRISSHSNYGVCNCRPCLMFQVYVYLHISLQPSTILLRKFTRQRKVKWLPGRKSWLPVWHCIIFDVQMFSC
jgi:hypothetical protein